MKQSEFTKMYKLENTHFWFVGKRFCIDAVVKLHNRHSKIRILDIGCGTGGTTLFLKKYGTVVGLENDAYAYTYAKKRLACVKMGSAEDLPFKDGSFDMVTLLDVLYHKNIHDVKRCIQEARRVLSRNGEIVITDSALPFLWSKHDEIMEGERRFFLREIEELLEKNGFTIVKSSYYFFILFPLVFIKRKIVDYIIGKRYKADVQELPTWINICGLLTMKVESFLLEFISFPYGSSLIVYAKKRS